MNINTKIVRLLQESAPSNLVTGNGNVLVDARWESVADVADVLGVDAGVLANDLHAYDESAARDRIWVTDAKDVPGLVVVLKEGR